MPARIDTLIRAGRCRGDGGPFVAGKLLIRRATGRRWWLVVARPLMRTIFGEDLERLRAQVGTHVAGGVAFFLAACRHRDVN